MPRGDGTGPMGEGPMTGRAAGYCAGSSAPGFASGFGSGRGYFRRGVGRFGGRGYRNRYYATGVPFSAYADPGPQMTAEEEQVMLKSESKRLKSVLETIDKRLSELGQDKA